MDTPASTGEWAAAARLVRRTGFGATGAQVDAAVAAGRTRYLATMLAADPVADPGARTTPLPHFDPVGRTGKGADRSTRQAGQAARKAQLATLTGWWLRRMATVQEPFGEKLTFLWHNHFATAATKVRKAGWLAAQNQTLRTLGRGDFHVLASAMLTDGAMLYWLDGEANTAAAPNENLSREFMELFALGHGDGYTETDVRQGARALTGWRIADDGSTSLDPTRHDNGVKTFLGVTGNLGAPEFCDAVLARPASGPFVCGRMYGQLVSDEPPSTPVLQVVSAAYGQTRDLKAMLASMLGADDFIAKTGSKVISPVEWLVGAVRALKVPVAQDAAVKKLVGILTALGQVPFYPPNVSGWPSGQAWLTTSAAEVRMKAAARLVAQGDIDVIRAAGASTRLDVLAHTLGVATWSNRTKTVLSQNVSSPDQLVAIALNTPEYLTH